MTIWQSFAFITAGVVFGVLVGRLAGLSHLRVRWIVAIVVLVAPVFYGFEMLALGRWEPW